MLRRARWTTPVFLLAMSLGLTVTAAGAASSHAPTCHIAHSAKLGNILVDPKGMTLYYFTVDKPNKSKCSGPCAHAWPPFLLPAGMKAPVKPAGLSGTLGSIPHGTHRQVTYNRRPLYTYFKDKKAGETLGQGVGQVWFVVKVH